MKPFPSQFGSLFWMNSESDGRTTSPIVPLRVDFTRPQIRHCAVSSLAMAAVIRNPGAAVDLIEPDVIDRRYSQRARLDGHRPSPQSAQNHRSRCGAAVIVQRGKLIHARHWFPSQDLLRVTG